MAREGSVFEGKTLDDAVRKGMESLGLTRAEVIITVEEEGSGGFLGLGARPYRVRIMPRPGGAIAEAGSEEGGRRGRGERRGGRERGPREARGGRREGGRDRGRGGPRSDAGGRGRGEQRGQGTQTAEAGAREHDGERGRERDHADRGREGRGTAERGEQGRGGERAEGGPGRRRRRSGRREHEGGRAGSERRNSAPAARREPAEPRGESPGREPGGNAEPEAPTIAPEELAAEGKRWAEDLLRHMGFEANVKATAEGDRVDVAVELTSGEDLLTGRKGEVRQALQHLLNLMINHGGRSRHHLQLEVNEFWQRREGELQELARELAEEALSTGREAVTEYLNAQERRVIHMALKEDSRVKTYALGTGLIKRVAIAPADFPEGPTD
jgi:spoIIIJ-associated protein